MKPAHIAFFSFPHFPDVNPTLAVVATLVRRGFRVTYVTSERFAATVSDLGAEFVRCPPFSNPFDRVTGIEESHEHPAIPLATRTLSDVMPFYATNRPDLIVYDFVCLAGRILAEKWNIPAIQTSPAFALDPLHLDQQPKGLEFREAVLTAGRAMNRLLAHHGIVRGNHPFYREQLNIYFYPEALQLDGDAFDETCFYAGRCAAERPHQRKWRRHRIDDRPILLVSTSTVYIQGPAYFKMCVDALSGLKWHVILAIGDRNDPAAFDPLPPHFEIMQHVPQIEVLPYVDFLICLGGMITTGEAMYHGIPLLMLTNGYPEAEAYAENNARLGLGRHLEEGRCDCREYKKCPASDVGGSCASGECTKKMQRAVQRSPGAEDTVNRITEYLESKNTSSVHA